MGMINDHAVPSCLMHVEAAKRKTIITIEGLADEQGTLHPEEQAFAEKQAPNAAIV